MNKVKRIRDEAEKCVREGDLSRAAVLYGEIIAASADPPQDNLAPYLAARSKCLLRLGRFREALDDADEIVAADSDSSIGHAKKADVLMAVGDFELGHEALLTAFKAAKSAKEKEAFMDQIKKCKREVNRVRAMKEQFPWVGAAVGIVVSVLGVVADVVVNKSDSLIAHPLLKVGIVVLVASTCYFFATRYKERKRNYFV